MSDNPDRRCGTCRFFGLFGDCYRYPPMPAFDPGTHVARPIRPRVTEKTPACGEWKEDVPDAGE